MRQRGSQFAFELVFGFFDFAQHFFVLFQQQIRVVSLFFQRVGVFLVEVEDRPIEAITCRLRIARLQAQRFSLGA
ncbi:hypothetical protein D3C76_1807150 [compost metagenome]